MLKRIKPYTVAKLTLGSIISGINYFNHELSPIYTNGNLIEEEMKQLMHKRIFIPFILMKGGLYGITLPISLPYMGFTYFMDDHEKHFIPFGSFDNYEISIMFKINGRMISIKCEDDDDGENKNDLNPSRILIVNLVVDLIN